MLESYFVKPHTVDRVRASWIGPEIERYVVWLAENGYTARSVLRRVPLLVAFGEFAWARGARTVGDLPAHVEVFVVERIAERPHRRCAGDRHLTNEVRGPIEQMLSVVVSDFMGSGRPYRGFPFGGVLPGFSEYLACERGLRPSTIRQYRYHLGACFEAYLAHVGVKQLRELSPALISAFVAERSGAGVAKVTVGICCGILRVFLRYAYREGLLARDLSQAVEGPQNYRLADIPRSISWAEVDQVLACVDRRTPAGKRDYAIYVATPIMLPAA